MMAAMETNSGWARCNSCKGDIDFAQLYYVCSVSTCNRKGSDFRFCSVECWDAHVPVMRHRDAWAEERRSPTEAEWRREQAAETADDDEPPRPAPATRPTTAAATLRDEGIPRDVLVVVSKLKAYIRARSGMNTSDTVLDVLSDRLRSLCDQAIDNAAADGRKTVMDRDFR
jgi:histone H3/H4